MTSLTTKQTQNYSFLIQKEPQKRSIDYNTDEKTNSALIIMYNEKIFGWFKSEEKLRKQKSSEDRDLFFLQPFFIFNLHIDDEDFSNMPKQNLNGN